MQTALEPFMQPGVQETKENILLSTLLSLLASGRGKGERGLKKSVEKKKKVSPRSDVLSGRAARSAL